MGARLLTHLVLAWMAAKVAFFFLLSVSVLYFVLVFADFWLLFQVPPTA